jgi:hypothetical protein
MEITAILGNGIILLYCKELQRNIKHEILNPKYETNSKHKGTKHKINISNQIIRNFMHWVLNIVYYFDPLNFELGAC